MKTWFKSRECATTHPLGQKEMWDWHTTETIKKQQTLEQVLYRVPNHCIRTVKTATSYTDRTKLLYTIALMSTNPSGSHAKATQTESCSQEACHSPPAHKNSVTRRTSQRIQRVPAHPRFHKRDLVTSTKE